MSAPFIYPLLIYHMYDHVLSYIEMNVTLLHYYSRPSIKLFPSFEIENSYIVGVWGGELFY